MLQRPSVLSLLLLEESSSPNKEGTKEPVMLCGHRAPLEVSLLPLLSAD